MQTFDERDDPPPRFGEMHPGAYSGPTGNAQLVANLGSGRQFRIVQMSGKTKDLLNIRHKARAAIEPDAGKLKCFRRSTMMCENLAARFGTIVGFGSQNQFRSNPSMA